jgi:hypothetical protein
MRGVVLSVLHVPRILESYEVYFPTVLRIFAFADPLKFSRSSVEQVVSEQSDGGCAAPSIDAVREPKKDCDSCVRGLGDSIRLSLRVSQDRSD